jgi:hypothetical protein
MTEGTQNAALSSWDVIATFARLLCKGCQGTDISAWWSAVFAVCVITAESFICHVGEVGRCGGGGGRAQCTQYWAIFSQGRPYQRMKTVTQVNGAQS